MSYDIWIKSESETIVLVLSSVCVAKLNGFVGQVWAARETELYTHIAQGDAGHIARGRERE